MTLPEPAHPPAAAAPRALIADDEPLLREDLARRLAAAWPGLRVVAQAPNGREAVRLFEEHRPDVCFLDIHMPGLSGLDAARRIGRRAQLVFVTAHDDYAVQAFAERALDYLVKPVEPARLAETVARLRERLLDAAQAAPAPPPAAATAAAALDADALLAQLAERLRTGAAPAGGDAARPHAAAGGPLRWLRAASGTSLRLIPVDAVDYLRSDEKYTLVAWRDDDGRPSEALLRTPLKDLVAQLDAARFAQVHRSVVVNLGAIARVARGANETADVHLRGRPEVLRVSRSYLHLFRQM